MELGLFTDSVERLSLDEALDLAQRIGATGIERVTRGATGELARRGGAHHVSDLWGTELRDSLREQVRAAVGKLRVDIRLENVGGEVFEQGWRARAWRGRMVVVGFASMRLPPVRMDSSASGMPRPRILADP